MSNFSADLGGTEIFTPLERIFQRGIKEPRNIFLLTDGQVPNRERVINLIGANTRSSRVHALGIGSGVDKILIEKCARAGKGAAQIIEQGESM